MKKHIALASMMALIAITSCREDYFELQPKIDPDAGKIELAGQIQQEYVTRANDDGFADGDVMGVYVVDYNGIEPGTLLSKGNRGDNVRHTFNEAAYSWSSSYDLYWKDKNTAIDVYGYYPFGSPGDVNNYKFSVRTNQHQTPGDGSMGDYEASDFLWGKVSGVQPTTNVIRVPMQHRMASARVTLVEGSGFGSGEWTSIEKELLVSNTINEATIDLATGEVRPDGVVSPYSIVPSKRGDEWRAIVVPQQVTAGTVMFKITIAGIPYKFVKGENFEYQSGKMSNFAIRVDKKEMGGAYTLTLISESITPWENDLVSHDATLKEYVIVNSTPGGLKDAITAAGKDYKTLKNLKITGEINYSDFYFMRDEMGKLSALNLKEVIINDPDRPHEIPNEALSGKQTLISLVLPDKLTAINENAFRSCRNLTGSLIIPEGVVKIRKCAFWDCINFTGSLSLPSTLKQIGEKQGYTAYWDGPFGGCNFTCELILPEGLEILGVGAFNDCKRLYGNLRLPENLKWLGESAFGGCKNLTGSLEIPQGVTTIPLSCFNGCWFGGTLTLHDGITAIDEAAFSNCGFRGELNLPKNLESISKESFHNNDFSGKLVLPKGLRNIGERAFANNWRLMGVLEIPENVISISPGAFAHCRSLEGLILPEALETICYEASYGEDGGAFQGCFGLGSIVSKSDIPPYIQPGAFDGVAKDNFTVEVPETSVAQYRVAPGWSDFKRVEAHRELVCRPSLACALSSEHRQTLILNSEGEWEVASKPDWCTLSQTSGNKKTELTLTIREYPATSGQREGDIVFRLKGKGYTSKCHVTQHGYQYAEDQYITLQKASKGNNGGINIVFLGDGYDASNIADGTYLKDMQEGMEHFFGIEPFTTYRNYFNVYTALSLSTETGVGTVNTIRYNRFSTTYTGGVGLRCDYDAVFEYALKAPTVTPSNLDQTLIVIIPNSTDYGGICQMWESGAAIAFSPKSTYGYPLDSRGVMQHEAGGHGFGKLGDEYIYHNAFIDACGCTCCGHVDAINGAKALGWYDNLELTGKTHKVGWSHLIFHPQYSGVVDIFEGGYMHTRGVFRSEQNSCMNNDIPYYNAISRESIVKRIKRYAGEPYSFEEFVRLDNPVSKIATRSASGFFPTTRPNKLQALPPTIHKGSPLSKINQKRKNVKK